MVNCRGLLSLVPVLFIACGGLGAPFATSAEYVSVSLHGVNYTDRPFQYVVIDPKDQNNTGGGEHVGPFSAGGIVCCYTLPKIWTPGLQVQVRTTHWLPKDASGKLPEVTKVHTVEIPRYANGEAGELWVLRTKDGSIEVVSSNYQPNHPNWPGRVKGWPEPSVEYRKGRFESQKKIAEGRVNNYRELIADLERDPRGTAQKSWDVDSKVAMRMDELKEFTGPADPAYLNHLRNRYEKGLRNAQQRLNQFMDQNQ